MFLLKANTRDICLHIILFCLLIVRVKASLDYRLVVVAMVLYSF